MRGEIEWKFKSDMCTLLYLKQHAFHETTIKAMQEKKSNASWPNKRWSILCLRYPVWCHLPHEAACLCSKSIQSCLTLCEPMRLCRSLGSSVHRILQARILEWVAIPFSRESSWPRGRTHVSHVSCIGRRILYHWVIGEGPSIISQMYSLRVLGFQGYKQDNKIPLSLDPHCPIK